MICKGMIAVISNPESYYDGKLVSVMSVYGDKAICIYRRPFIHSNGETWHEIVYLTVKESDLEPVDTEDYYEPQKRNNKPIEHKDYSNVFATIGNLCSNYAKLSEQDKVRLSEKYVKLMRELLE